MVGCSRMSSTSDRSVLAECQATQPAACPFCGCEMTVRSNRDWHHLEGDHNESCPFDDRPESTMTVPATDEQLRLMIGDWNRRHNDAVPGPRSVPHLNEASYLRIVAELQEIARRAPYVTQEWVLQVASMDPDDMRRRLIRNFDWHGHFAHSLDGIPDIHNIGGGGIDGCRSHKEVRAIVLDLLRQIGRLKAADSDESNGAILTHSSVELSGDDGSALRALQRWENYRAEMQHMERQSAKLARNFLELGAYEDAAKCAIKAEGMRFVLGRMPSPLP